MFGPSGNAPAQNALNQVLLNIVHLVLLYKHIADRYMVQTFARKATYEVA